MSIDTAPLVRSYVSRDTWIYNTPWPFVHCEYFPPLHCPILFGLPTSPKTPLIRSHFTPPKIKSCVLIGECTPWSTTMYKTLYSLREWVWLKRCEFSVQSLLILSRGLRYRCGNKSLRLVAPPPPQWSWTFNYIGLSERSIICLHRWTGIYYDSSVRPRMILGRTGFIYVNPAVQLDLIAWRAFMLARLPSPIAIYSKTVSGICGRDRLKRARTCCLLNLLLLMYICAGQIIDAV